MFNPPNYALKGQVIAFGLDKLYSRCHLADFRCGGCSFVTEMIKRYSFEVVDECRKVNQAKFARERRVVNRVRECLKTEKAVFLTLTFRDDRLSTSTEQSRRIAVARALKEQCSMYVANVDYGNDGDERIYFDRFGQARRSTAREHYHALVVLRGDKFDMNEWRKVYGFAYAERVPVKDVKKVAKYVAKLSNHALKVTFKRAPRLLYSRNKKV